MSNLKNTPEIKTKTTDPHRSESNPKPRYSIYTNQMTPNDDEAKGNQDIKNLGIYTLICNLNDWYRSRTDVSTLESEVRKGIQSERGWLVELMRRTGTCTNKKVSMGK